MHGTVGYFSSGWPVAYLAATVILGIGLTIGAYCMCPSPYSSPGNPSLSPLIPPLSSMVGRITGMVDCQWARVLF